MEKSVRRLCTNFFVGILGFFIGFYNLLLWINDNSFTRELIIGVICLVPATVWIIYGFIKMKPINNKFNMIIFHYI